VLPPITAGGKALYADLLRLETGVLFLTDAPRHEIESKVDPAEEAREARKRLRVPASSGNLPAQPAETATAWPASLRRISSLLQVCHCEFQLPAQVSGSTDTGFFGRPAKSGAG
jgi:hypothetical protein